MTTFTADRPLPAFFRAFGRRAKLYDLLAASPLIIWYVWSFFSQTDDIAHRIAAIQSDPAIVSLLLAILSKLALFGFGVTLVFLLIVRRPPLRKHAGPIPRAIAFLGCYLGIAFLVLPVQPPHSYLMDISAFLIFTGMGFAFFSLFWLGRSFSIMPESRKLVTSGPYSLVRHPLYLGEQVALVGVALQCTSPLALALFVLQICCQLYRMSYEEKILTESFPEYETYCADTARILPWLY
jgi:protein-S-isoprenylcysteine O-methyltransferase Ste14